MTDLVLEYETENAITWLQTTAKALILAKVPDKCDQVVSMIAYISKQMKDAKDYDSLRAIKGGVENFIALQAQPGWYKTISSLNAKFDLEYRQELKRAVLSANWMRDKLKESSNESILQKGVSKEHLFGMCDKIDEMAASAKSISDLAKIHRWLGYLNGVAVATYGISLDEIITITRDAGSIFEKGWLQEELAAAREEVAKDPSLFQAHRRTVDVKNQD